MALVALCEAVVNNIQVGIKAKVSAMIAEMKKTRDDYKALAADLEKEAGTLKDEANAQREIAENTDDLVKKAAALALAASLEAQARAKEMYAKALNKQADALDKSIGDLSNELDDADKDLVRLIKLMVNADLVYAKTLGSVFVETGLYNYRMQAISDNFDTYITNAIDSVSSIGPLDIDKVREKVYDMAYDRAMEIYDGNYKNFSNISDENFALLSAFAGILGVDVHKDGKIWNIGYETELKPIFSKRDEYMTNQGETLIIHQFFLKTNPRYSPTYNKVGEGKGDWEKNGETYTYVGEGKGNYRRKTRCDLFVCDYTLAMGAPIPYYYNTTTGEPVDRKTWLAGSTEKLTDGLHKGDPPYKESSASNICTWLNEFGSEYGWNSVTTIEDTKETDKGADIQKLADKGAVLVGGRNDHVQAIIAQNAKMDEPLNNKIPLILRTAQAGATNTPYGNAWDLMTPGMKKPVTYYSFTPK